jgi:hypothetical protein
METGTWSLKIDGIDELTDLDREYIADLILNGYICGEIIHDD